MTLIEVSIKKEDILQPDYKVCCPVCNEQFFSPFDKLYISVKGACFTCKDDDKLSENIFYLLQ